MKLNSIGGVIGMLAGFALASHIPWFSCTGITTYYGCYPYNTYFQKIIGIVGGFMIGYLIEKRIRK